MVVYNDAKVKKALRGVKVEVTHRGNVRRKYRISGLTSRPTRELMYDVFPLNCLPLFFNCILSSYSTYQASSTPFWHPLSFL